MFGLRVADIDGSIAASWVERLMSGKELFDDLREMAAPRRDASGGRVRLRHPERDQIEWRSVDLDSLIAASHPARVVWRYVEKLDLRELEERVRAREHTPGQAPVTPRLLLALWLYATSQGVGSARALDRLCRSHDDYRWLCGGVSVNYHGLADFRSGQGALLDRLLTENIAALWSSGLIELVEVTQDGVRVRASAGASSFRRQQSLHKHLEKARRLVDQLKREVDTDADASNRRIQAAQERAAREREQRIEQALRRRDELEAERQRRARTNKKQVEKQKEPRASTTDAEARVMKMADGGYRPAFNCQIGTVGQGQVVVELGVDTTGSDRGQLRPMLEQLRQRHGKRPDRYLVDGGFTRNEDIEWAHGEDIEVYGPAANNKHKTDPYAPHPKDGPGVAAWRERMKSPDGQTIYKRRAMGECINARFRQWGLRQLTVRGTAKVRTVLLWFALANNILAGHRLQNAAAA
jgi:transposase